MNRAVCFRCGNSKAGALEACPHCGFQPASETEQAQSLVLSPAFEMNGKTMGRSSEELSDIAMQIQAGKPYAFSRVELDVVMREQRLAKAMTPRRLMENAVKWLARLRRPG